MADDVPWYLYHGGPILTSALSGIDQALWDILGRWLNVPVSQLLGGAVRERVRMYGHVGGETDEALRQSAEQAVAQGMTVVKTSIGGPARFSEPPGWVRAQIARLQLIRETIGPYVDLAVDFHGRIQPALAVTLCQAIEAEALNPLFVEEPCLVEDLDAMRRIARSTRIPIAAGERCYTKYGFRELLNRGGVSVVQPDLAHCGGISEGLTIARMAESHFAAFAPHNPLGPINLAASLNVSAAVANFLAQEQVSLGQGYLKTPFVLEDGYIRVPTGPGLGIEVDEAYVAAHQYDGSWDTPHWVHGDDGSVADW
jgi:galactonate dehydratase